MSKLDTGWPELATCAEAHFGDRVVRCLVDRPSDLNALFAARVAGQGACEAVVAGDVRLSYHDLDRHVAALAGALVRRAVEPGDRVALLIGNRAEFLIALLAAIRIGAIAVPLGTRAKRPELLYALNDCDAKALVFEAPLRPELPVPADLPALERRIVVGAAAPGEEPFAKLVEEPGALATARPALEDQTAVILYTSGTTGRPKGALLSHLGLVHSAMHFRACLGLGPEDRALLAVPAAHVTGLVAILMAMLGAGGASVLLREFKAKDFLALASAERVTYSLIVPAMYKLCLLEPDSARYDLSAWRLGGFGGAPMPEATIAELAQRWPNLTLFNAYGATETTSPTSIMPLGHTARAPDSIGCVVPCGEVKIMDEEGREVPPGEPGEIWVSGPMVVRGYWAKPVETATAFVGGFWRSGDVGSLDAQGYLRLHDRRKDMINRAGYKVYSAEVENVLARHDSVIECAVVARPDPVLGERVQAFVRLSDGAVDAETLKRFCAEVLSDYKVPEVITLTAAPLPRNANGKIVKETLRAAVAAELKQGDKRR